MPQRLVQDGVVEEAAMLTALQAAKDRKASFVTQLIAAGAAKARDIAVAASAEFGVPLYDLDSHNVDLDTVKRMRDDWADEAKKTFPGGRKTQDGAEPTPITERKRRPAAAYS